MWKIHRYYLREISVNAVLTFFVLFGIGTICFLYRGIRIVKGGDLVDAVITTMLLAADAIPQLLTVSFLVATVMVFARASQDREITALRSAGISPRVALVAALLLGIVCSVIAAVCNHYLIPTATYKKFRVVAELSKKALANLTRQEGRISLGGGTMVWKTRKGGEFQDVLIFVGDQSLARTLQVGSLGKCGTLVRASAASIHTHEHSNQLSLHLHGIEVVPGGGSNSDLTITVDLVQLAEGRTRAVRDWDLRSDELLAEVARGVRSGRGAEHAHYTVNRRACLALMPFLLAPIGFCVGLLARDRGRVQALSFCMVPLSIVFVTDLLGENLFGRIHSSFSSLIAWLPAVVILLLGTPFCWRLLRI